jgi:hypothetical protein
MKQLKKLLFLLTFSLALTTTTMAQISFLDAQKEGTSTDYKVIGYTNNSTPWVIDRYDVQPGESGTVLIRYNGADQNGLSANRWKIVRFSRTPQGVLTVKNVQSLYTNNDTGMTTIDYTVTASGGQILITVTGSSSVLMHSLRVEILSGVLQ